MRKRGTGGNDRDTLLHPFSPHNAARLQGAWSNRQLTMARRREYLAVMTSAVCRRHHHVHFHSLTGWGNERVSA
jgi:hypothetical protein